MLNTYYNLNQDLARGDHGRCNQNAASGASGVGYSGWSVRSAARTVESKGFADSPTSSVDVAFGSRSVGPSN
jgi:hypothetical protein